MPTFVWLFSCVINIIEILPAYIPTMQSTRGFTLIELSIVLVIIALIVGSVLVGRDLIEAAAIRSQITQIEKFNTAAKTFKIKYDCLPGDCAKAATYGFIARGPYAGQGDGNNILEGMAANNAGADCGCSLSGEQTVFWIDLSMANLIEYTFNTDTATALSALTATDIPNYLPKAKLGTNYIAVWGGASKPWPGIIPQTGDNYFALANYISTDAFRNPVANLGITPLQAYSIDNKIDDGMPQSGGIVAQYWKTGGFMYWAGTNIHSTTVTPIAPYTTSTAASATSCFDNNSTAGDAQRYSTSFNNLTCAITIKFQ